MAFIYDIDNKNKDTLSSKFLFICHFLGTVGSVFISTFFIAHIYTISSDTYNYIFNVGLYYAITYITFLIVYYLSSFIVDRTNRVCVYRVATLIRCAVVIIMIFFGENLATIIPLAGFMYGLGESMYYASYNVIKQEMVGRNIMRRYATGAMIASKIFEIITPITLGTIINSTSFKKSAIIVSVVSFIIFVMTFFIHSKKPENSHYSMTEYFKMLKEKDDDAILSIKFLYIISFIYGFSTVVGALTNICIMLQFNSSLSLGKITSAINFIAMIELILLSRFTKPGQRNWAYYTCMAFPVIGVTLFTVMPSMTTIVIYNFCMAVSAIFFKTTFDIFRNGVLKEAGLYDEISEHHTIVESLLCIARVLSFSLMIGISFIKSDIIVYVLLILFSLAYPTMLLLMANYEKRYVKKSV